MSSKGKFGKWITDNIVLLVGIPLIIGVHYGWSRLQNNPELVDQSKKKEVPIVAAFHSIKNKYVTKFITDEENNRDANPES